MIADGSRISAHAILDIPFETFLDLDGKIESFIIEYDDGERVSTVREMIYTYPMWGLFRLFPEFIINKKHHLSEYGEVLKDVPVKIMRDIYWDNYLRCRNKGYTLDRGIFTSKMYDIADDMFEFYRQCGSYVISMSIMDFIDIMDNPRVQEAEDRFRSLDTVYSRDVQKLYQSLTVAAKKDKTMYDVKLATAARIEAIKIGQYWKVCGASGFVTDVDSTMFPNAIRNNYIRGLTRIEDMAVVSRTASMSITYQQDAMRKSEYLTRMIQSGAAGLSRVHHGVDCGSMNYLPVPTSGMTHLRNFEGIYYLDPRDNTEKLINPKDPSLLGGVINIRSPLTCQLPDRSGVCERCYGELAMSIMPEDNIGWMAATTIQEDITQNILSNKHLVGSASIEVYTFTGDDFNYLNHRQDSHSIWLSNKLKRHDKVYILFGKEEATKLQDIYVIEDIDSLTPKNIAKLIGIRIQCVDNDIMVKDMFIPTSNESRQAYFTTEMLKYIRSKGVSVTHDGSYMVDVTDWDWEEPMLGLPLVQFTTPAHMLALKSFWTSAGDPKKKSTKTLTQYHTPVAGLMALYDLLSLRLEINFTHQQVLVASMLCEDPDNYDYRIPLNKKDGTFATYDHVMTRRDTGCAMSYEAHYKDFIAQPATYIIPHRQAHPFSLSPAG